MERRNFLQMLSAAAAIPVLPGGGAALAATNTAYNRYTYGLAVFHARTRATLSAADLASKLRVGPDTAGALLSEMHSKGVITPALTQAGTMRAVTPIHQPIKGTTRIARAVEDWLAETGTGPETDPAPAPEENGVEQTVTQREQRFPRP